MPRKYRARTGVRRDLRIPIKVNTEEYSIIMAAATLASKTISGYMVDLAMAAQKVPAEKASQSA